MAWRCPSRHMPIVSSTRLYIVPFLARTMQFPLREKIAGEIALSEQPGKTMRKWREGLRNPEKGPAPPMRGSPAAASDQERRRRVGPRARDDPHATTTRQQHRTMT